MTWIGLKSIEICATKFNSHSLRGFGEETMIYSGGGGCTHPPISKINKFYMVIINNVDVPISCVRNIL